MIQEAYGVVIAGGSVVTMARLESLDGTPIDPAMISTVQYSIYERDPCSSGAETAVPGHENQPIDPSSVLYDSLQTDVAWDLDAQGYNFRYEIDTTTDPAFSNPGRTYRLRYEATPNNGQPILFRYLIEAI